ncbi:MAG: S1 RNA-binding domain-containing protein, partial [Acidimicrobiia bacterium]
MTDTTLSPASAMGTFDQSGNYVPRKITERDASFADEFANTFRDIKEGKLVTGTVVRITREEVLVEIGFKTEGVILARELTIRQDVDPATVVKLGESVEALVLTLEDKEGRLLLSAVTCWRSSAQDNVTRSRVSDS